MACALDQFFGFQAEDIPFDDEELKWLRHYERPFPPVVRHYLGDIMENWVKLEYYAEDDPGFAERVLVELKSKANKLPISDEMRLNRQEVLRFYDTHIGNPAEFLEMIKTYRSKELMETGEVAQSNLVKRLSRSTIELKQRLSILIQTLATEHSLSISEAMKMEILTYCDELKQLIESTAEIKDFVQQTLTKLRQFQVIEAKCQTFYIKEMAEWWKSFFTTIENLFWQVNMIAPHLTCPDGQPAFDTSPLYDAIRELVSTSMIIVDSPRLNERTLRVKKKKVTYRLQILLPELSDGTSVTAALLSEDGFARLRKQPLHAEPNRGDCGAHNLYQDTLPVIKDANSQDYYCVFNELGFETMVRERKRGRSGTVMSAKYVYMFRAKLTYDRQQYWARCFSMPVVMASHNDQSVSGAVALFWDDYFQESGREGLETRTNVSWNEIGGAISNLIFRQTGKRLTDLNLRFLRSVFLGARREEVEMDDDGAKFQMADMVRFIDTRLTFWDWLWGTITMMTMKESAFLLNLWTRGYVVGYISREDAEKVIEEMLEKETKHFFLLRFSKRDGRAVVLQGYIEGPDPNKDPLGIFSVDPYKPEHLRETSLQQRIMKRRDCEAIVYQDISGGWSFIEKEKVFTPDKHVRRYIELPEGYVGREVTECTERVLLPEQVECEPVMEDYDITSELSH